MQFWRSESETALTGPKSRWAAGLRSFWRLCPGVSDLRPTGCSGSGWLWMWSNTKLSIYLKHMRFFCDYVSQCISCVAQDNSSSSSVAQRHQKVRHPWVEENISLPFLVSRGCLQFWLLPPSIYKASSRWMRRSHSASLSCFHHSPVRTLGPTWVIQDKLIISRPCHRTSGGSGGRGPYFPYHSIMNEPFATAWMELESIMLSEISQVGKDEYHMISPLSGI